MWQASVFVRSQEGQRSRDPEETTGGGDAGGGENIEVMRGASEQ